MMTSELPSTYKKLVVKELTTDFRKAVAVETVPLKLPGPKEVLVKNKYVGVNASDINFSAGRYFTEKSPPFDIGSEGVGEIVAVGDGVTEIKVGQAVAYIALKAYAEYVCLPSNSVFMIPEVKPKYIGLLLGGLTASIGLDKPGRITEGDTVFITAAAGGTGHVAVQWAKAAGCHVIGICSSEEKMSLLKGLGCDTVVNYKTENLHEVLKKEFPNGIDVIWETIGGNMFHTCVQHLSVKGRLIIVGGITSYKSEDPMTSKSDLSYLTGLLLLKSACVQGFLVRHYAECFPTYFKYLRERFEEGELKIVLDNGKGTAGNEFIGFEGIIDGVEHLHSGQSIGKVFVKMS